MGRESRVKKMTIPIIGQPEIIGVNIIIVFYCRCKNAIMSQVGKVKCNKCNKTWLMEAGLNLKITEIVDSTGEIGNKPIN